VRLSRPSLLIDDLALTLAGIPPPAAGFADIHWYARDQETSADAAARARADEIRKVKEAEEDALAVALCVFLPRCVQEQWLILAHAHSNSGFEPAVRLTDEERELQRLAKEQEKVLKAARKA
jgi:hypothetical protein